MRRSILAWWNLGRVSAPNHCRQTVFSNGRFAALAFGRASASDVDNALREKNPLSFGNIAESFPRACGIAATVLVLVGVSTTYAAAQGQPQRGPGEPQPQPGMPPPARELTPAEIGALQTMMTNRAAGTILTPGNADALRRSLMETQGMLPPSGTLGQVKVEPRSLDVDPQVLLSHPQSIQLALGVVTPLTFLDSNGHTWPVEAVAFDPRMFAQDGNGCGSAPPNTAIAGAGNRPSTITMMPCRINTYGNVSIKLENYPLPIVLMAKSGGNETVDLPVTVHVRGRSPDAPQMPAEAMAAYSPPQPVRTVSTRHGRKGGSGETLPDRYLDTFGAGAPPSNAQRVEINDASVSGWILGGKLYLRGNMTVINPAQDAMAESVGGVKVWRFDHPVSRILIVDESGVERDLSLNF
jgi:intracellular multiplication protein IcmK